jgi:hypothetical protein
MRNPAWCPWQLHLALAESRDAPRRARHTALDAVARARQYGARSAIGHALLVAAQVCGGHERLTLLTEAGDLLAASPASHLLAQALVAHGAALREEGRSAQALDLLGRGLESALRCAADATAAQARAELARTATADGALDDAAP